MGDITFEQVVRSYVKTRDEIDAIADRHKAELAPHNEKLDKLEAWLLGKLNETGAENVRTEAGTAYKNTMTSITVADGEFFKNFILAPLASFASWPFIKSLNWQLMDIRASKKGIMEFIEQGNELPPGLNLKQFIKVNVRRA